MRKTLLIIALIFLALCPFANAQNIFEYNKSFEFGLGYSRSGTFAAMRDPKVTALNSAHVYLLFYGFYIDAGGCKNKDHTRNLGIEKYDGYKNGYLHVGYAIPVCRWAKIIPNIGYFYWAKGYWDGLDYTVDSNGIVNEFYAEHTYKKFDIGVTLSATFAKYFNAYVNVTLNNISVGLGAAIPWYDTE